MFRDVSECRVMEESGKTFKSSGITVLVVEDDHSFRDFLKLMLSAQGFKVLTVESPGKAMETAWTTPEVDLAYIDVNYENTLMTGFDLAEAIKKLKGPGFPFMIMSMNDDMENHRLSKKVGALGFAEKNYDCLEASIQYVKEKLDGPVKKVGDASHKVFSTHTQNPS